MGNIRHIASRVGLVEDFKLIENYRYGATLHSEDS